MASEALGSAQNMQNFLTILQGYNERIKSAQDSATLLVEEKKNLEYKIEKLRNDNENSMEKLKTQQSLVRCQEEHIALLQRLRTKPSGSYQYSGPHAAEKSDQSLGDLFAQSSGSQGYELLNNLNDEEALSFTGRMLSPSSPNEEPSSLRLQ
ncbi:hypothetical protein K4F52_010159 [Lecanicillium sp. MT-2017a]|nr:hypothetical protein K4F52_010159 [Lecanicillium sp. MT-2017a]